MINEENFLKAIKEMRVCTKKRNFDQTVDLIVNLKNFNVKTDGFNLFITLPNKIKDKKILAFLEEDSKVVASIKKESFINLKEKKDIKKLVKTYDFFISNIKLMPLIATKFGRIFGPAGKMPSPQLGILSIENEENIKKLIKKINLTIRIRMKEPSIKIAIAKESLTDKQIAENAIMVYNKILENLSKKQENLKNIKIKLTMGKPIQINLKE